MFRGGGERNDSGDDKRRQFVVGSDVRYDEDARCDLVSVYDDVLRRGGERHNPGDDELGLDVELTDVESRRQHCVRYLVFVYDDVLRSGSERKGGRDDQRRFDVVAQEF